MPVVNINTESDHDFYRQFVYMTASGAPIDLTDSVMWMTARKHASDATATFQVSTEDGNIVLTEPVNGKFTVLLSQALLLEISPGEYVQSLIREQVGGLRTKVWSGALTHAAGAGRQSTAMVMSDTTARAVGAR
jgi:hypothetical protein